MLTLSSDPDLAELQMNAIIFYLVAFGYIDGEFDFTEKVFIRNHIRKLVETRAEAHLHNLEPEQREEAVSRFVKHFHQVFEDTDYAVRDLFSEVVAKDEDLNEFVYAKLKLKSYEIFRSFDEDNQQVLLQTIDELIGADGKVHPAEAKFRDEIRALLDSTIPLDDLEIEILGEEIKVTAPIALPPKSDNHQFFAGSEQHYSSDPIKIRRQAEVDHELIINTMKILDEQRGEGKGKLAGKQTVAEFDDQKPFLDGHVYVHPQDPGTDCEVVVLGDLHGCYSCLKAALMQADFFAKVEAHKLDPKRNPDCKLVFLGDYIDRGRFSYNGVLRTVMQLLVAAPNNVFMLRGNHEYYLEFRGRIYGGVRPAEAINSLVGIMPDEMFETYMRLFDSLPNILLFGRNMFVHAGIPRDRDFAEKYKDLSSLNDPDLRFQMLWSDPSETEFVPEELQAANARFPFGQKQFERFMAKIGCTTLIRGHEKINEGFRSMYDDGNARLLNVFSAGGAHNEDLPPDSSYRTVTPMALTMMFRQGETIVTPWAIDYQRYNDPTNNNFFASPPEIAHKTD